MFYVFANAYASKISVYFVVFRFCDIYGKCLNSRNFNLFCGKCGFKDLFQICSSHKDSNCEIKTVLTYENKLI